MSKNTQLGNLVNGIYVDSTGKVGVGTQSPSNPLHISGAGTTLIKIQNTTSGLDVGLHLINTSVTAFMGANATEAFIYTQTNHPILFYTNLTEKMRITGAGAIGMNTNSPNSATVLTLQQSATLSGAISFLNRNSTQRFSIAIDAATVDDKCFSIIDNNVAAVRMVITPSGSLGIGTSSPSSISGAINLITRGISGSELSYIQATSFDGLCSVGLYSGVNSTDNPSLIFQRSLRFATASSLGTGGYSEHMRITSTGNVGIGTSSPSSKFSVVGNTSTIGNASIGQNTNGTAVIDAFNSFAYYGCNGSTYAIWIGPTGLVYNYSNTTTFNTTSDIRVKENISTVSNALDTISKLNPVTFDYNQDFAKKRTWDNVQKNNNIGFIAQEFETVFPKYVNTSEEVIGEETLEDFKTIDTGHLVPLLVAAIKELSAEINILKNK